MKLKEKIKQICIGNEDNITNEVILRSDEARGQFIDLIGDEIEVIDQVEKVHEFNRPEFVDRYIVYRWGDILVTRVLEKYDALGSPYVEAYSENADEELRLYVEPVEWVSREVSLSHWEDGEMNFVIYDIVDNRAKYLLGWVKEGAEKWGDFEYRDFGSKYDNEEYDKMFYEGGQ